jgi:hypothetical protein
LARAQVLGHAGQRVATGVAGPRQQQDGAGQGRGHTPRGHGRHRFYAGRGLRPCCKGTTRDDPNEGCYDRLRATNATPAAPSDVRVEIYDDYDAFLRQGIREYYARGWKSRRANFLALIIASGQIVSMATDSVRDGTGLKKAAFFVKNQKEITAKVAPYKTLITENRTKFEEIQGGYRAGRYDGAGRNLMVDGLLKGFLEQVDAT